MEVPKEASELSTRQTETRPGNAPPEATSWLSRAWLAVALVPVFFFLAFAVGEAAYAVLGYQPENADAPLWVDLVTGVLATAVCLVPCVAAVLYGWRANLVGDRTGLIPLTIGAIAGLSITALTVVSILGPF